MTKEQRDEAAKLRKNPYKYYLDLYRSALATCEAERDFLKEAISPGRIGGIEYYIGVATRMREKEMRIRALESAQPATPASEPPALKSLTYERGWPVVRAASEPQQDQPFNIPAAKEDDFGHCEACHEYPCRCDQ